MSLRRPTADGPEPSEEWGRVWPTVYSPEPPHRSLNLRNANISRPRGWIAYASTRGVTLACLWTNKTPGSRVITVPANGAAGAAGRVLRYYLKHRVHTDLIGDFLPTAAAAGPRASTSLSADRLRILLKQTCANAPPSLAGLTNQVCGAVYGGRYPPILE